MKKILIICVFLILATSTITGCNNNTTAYSGSAIIQEGKSYKANTLNEFKTHMEKNGFTIEDMFSRYNVRLANGVLMAKKGELEITFFDLLDSDIARSSFYYTRMNFRQASGFSNSIKHYNSINYERHSLESGGRYMLVARINNTLLYVNCESKLKNEAIDIFQELGY